MNFLFNKPSFSKVVCDPHNRNNQLRKELILYPYC